MGRSATSSSALTNRVQAVRVSFGLSQQQLGERAGLTRQAINAIEANRYTPNTIVSIRLAHALGLRVEELFRVEEALASVEMPSAGDVHRPGDRLVMGRVGARIVSHGLSGEHGIAEGFTGADGVAGERCEVRMFIPRDELERTAFLVGCDPSLGMLASVVTRRARNARLVWIPGSSKDALDALRRSTAHVAGIHLRDARSGDYNVIPGRKALAGGGIIVSYAHWQQGFVVQPGNPKGLKGVQTLLKRGVRIVNREPGSGSRALLDQWLAAAEIPTDRIVGYDHTVKSHMAVAREVANGVADVGIGLHAIARTLDLDFLPIDDVKFDLLIPNEHSDHPVIEVLLDVLRSGAMRAELAALPGYDSSQTGSVRSRFSAVA
jgi:putative molybdopterin biosynthesis protein